MSDGTKQASFTEAQQDVIAHLVLGQSNKEIAKALGVAIKTVKTHLTAIYKISGCATARELISAYYVRRILPDDRCPACGVRSQIDPVLTDVSE